MVFMGKPTGFKEYPRQAVPYRDPLARVQDFLEIFTAPEEKHLKTQGALWRQMTGSSG